MSDEQDNKTVEQRICLPKPDVSNITVLTRNLPNEPVLPWHRFDSPWLGPKEGEQSQVVPDEDVADGDTSAEAEADVAAQQLTLELHEASAELNGMSSHIGAAASLAEPDIAATASPDDQALCPHPEVQETVEPQDEGLPSESLPDTHGT